jgi:hypothetical protein
MCITLGTSPFNQKSFTVTAVNHGQNKIISPSFALIANACRLLQSGDLQLKPSKSLVLSSNVFLLCKQSISGVLNLLVTAYPQSKIVPLCVPPNQNCMPFAYPQIKNSTQKCFFLAGFLILRTPCDLFTYP